ncbi:cobalt-precorrin-5B (C1)-methyltransferase [Streptomyces sp. 2224.1]|uniref:cobalt-precorrin-5B (C(1))-methyltransferase n=1 Tax=unclassified Streptomyces TaxID=2593676 RepID=UPI00088F8E18|nr:cobalt-precorrin-5B (C1)-methyltransferase [Streptomyces sp. 2321.6]SDR41340.1 cobalt-precorrin-5B (C1)-methyltransferase [Streptomyces sp. KS_16]SEC03258.1 cobalt-precorrin-5B (C1)-methyltransferase [Streptomyces sp. 2224.1]SEC99994.1 cobalt-precorrin-5B (C1)-methyltransferase [Streptomyces sp. 2133.1]SEE75343.1 cobalt-precorrin-5B (C1)-methyltransferase [Streptomyces sp. 2112.3]SNC69619.1 cobalt-precorrin-5B (C1)-methyltransferase [Streptomyces sp. 2114.4]
MAEAQPQGTGRTGEGRTGPQGTGKAAGGRSAQLAHTGLRHGWTTGACATAASTAAYTALLSGEFPDPVTITLPKGQTPSFALAVEKLTVEELTVEELTGEGPAPGRTAAMAGVVKDAGDDPDVTHGALVRATVRALPPGSGVVFKAGPGVGTVTRPGLPLDVGEPAVNPVPRQMMREHLAEVAAQYGGPGAAADVEVEISVDHGEEIARSTWNPRLGILGGLSILGTTGIVVPYSCSAWIDSIRRGVDVARAAGRRHVAGCTGSTSEKAAVALHHLPEDALLDMGDFAGAVLKYIRRHPVERLTICGGFAKLSKLAAGHLDLHSARSQVDKGFLAELARRGGADEALAQAVAEANTGLAALQLCAAADVPLGDLVAATARDESLAVLRGAPVAVDVICIDRAGMVVGRAEPRGPGEARQGARQGGPVR